MSAESYERYREALREGHLAAQRGDHAAAMAVFTEAGALAPDRPLPHVGMGNALRELGRLSEAMAAFDRALALAPLDEGALGGRAATLVALGRTAEAAAALTGLAESLEADGRPGDALDPARQALALDSSSARFRLVARLSAAAQAAGGPDRGATGRGASDGIAGHVAVSAGANAAGGSTAGSSRPASRTRPVGATLVAEADARVDAGRTAEARDRYLLAARALREGGRFFAALDACYLALAIAPADAELHLILAELYDERGWSGQAADKLVLLSRLLDLEGDRTTRDRLCGLVAARFSGDPRLAAICA
jgi:tetratricopeptide (TPR) repeat protein